MESGTTQTESLDPSELGTKEYWDALYDRELHNHGEDPEDEGTIWFSECSAEEAVLKQLDLLADNGLLTRGAPPTPDDSTTTTDSTTPTPSRFLDLGTGNGHMLLTLLEDDADDGSAWHGEMLGVDYSDSSVQLARRIAMENLDGEREQLSFERWDLLHDSPGDWLGDGFDVVLDKGTFDAISLMRRPEGLQHQCDVYREKVVPLVKRGGFLLVTSCNWTRDELLHWLVPEAGELLVFSEAKYPSFTFGGKVGQSVVTIVFRRKAEKDVVTLVIAT